MNAPLCDLLGWDSEFFGFPIARVRANRLSAGDAPAILEWCAAEHVRCLYLLASGTDLETARIAAESGFRFVDVRVTLECIPMNSSAPSTLVRSARPEDARTLAAIARVSHTDSRFYWDGGFPRELCDRLYETWIEKSLAGDARRVLVAEHDGEAAGYITCDWSGDTGRIGLIAVAKQVRGTGMGSALVQAALAVFHEAGVRRVTVVTQGRNVPAQRLYQRCGFVTSAVEIWYHAWFEN